MHACRTRLPCRAAALPVRCMCQARSPHDHARTRCRRVWPTRTYCLALHTPHTSCVCVCARACACACSLRISCNNDRRGRGNNDHRGRGNHDGHSIGIHQQHWVQRGTRRCVGPPRARGGLHQLRHRLACAGHDVRGGWYLRTRVGLVWCSFRNVDAWRNTTAAPSRIHGNKPRKAPLPCPRQSTRTNTARMAACAHHQTDKTPTHTPACPR